MKRPKLKKRATLSEVVDYVLQDAEETPQVVVGPFCWRFSPDTGRKYHYFTIATGDRDSVFRVDQVVVNSKADRAAVFRELVRRGQLVIHDVDDELHMARLCEILWPGERVTQLRQNVEAERAHG